MDERGQLKEAYVILYDFVARSWEKLADGRFRCDLCGTVVDEWWLPEEHHNGCLVKRASNWLEKVGHD